MPTTRKKTAEKKPAAAPAAAKAPKTTTAPKAKVAAARPAAKVAKAPAAKAVPVKKAAAAAPAAAKPAAAPKKAAPAPKAAAPAAAPKKAPAIRRPRAPAWEPRLIPVHEIDGKAADPRLAAALAARERWHGRSGRPALKSGTQAVAFVRERLLVHPTTRSALPNLVDPIVGRVCTPDERETGPIAQTLKGWSREVRSAPDLLEARLCFEQPTLIAGELWPALITVAAPREEAARSGGLLSEEAEEALEILDRKGVVATERLRQLLGLDAAAFARVHAEMESRLLVLSRGDLDEDDNPITVMETLRRWSDRAMPKRPELEVGRAWTFLFIAALRSAVVLWPEELEMLFPWTREERQAAIDEALTTGSLISYTEAGSTAWVASPVPR